MKIAGTAFWCIFVFCLPLLLITTNIRWGVSSARLYEYGFSKYQMNQVTGIGQVELKEVARHLIDYFNARTDSAQMTVNKGGEKFNLFSQKELIHLQDVRDLIQLDYWVQRGALAVMVVCALLLLLWLRNGWRVLVRGLFWGSVVTLGLMIFLALWALFGFDQLFLLFHLVSFSNEYWMLDPSQDYLIMLFPGGFFYDAAIFGFGAMIVEAAVIGGVTFVVSRFAKGQRISQAT